MEEVIPLIPQVTVQELKPPRPLQAILQDYSKRGRSGRGGFWVAKPCVVCGQFFDIRQHPNKPENLRKTCGPLCSIENRHRKSKEWRLANPLTPAGPPPFGIVLEDRLQGTGGL